MPEFLLCAHCRYSETDCLVRIDWIRKKHAERKDFSGTLRSAIITRFDSKEALLDVIAKARTNIEEQPMRQCAEGRWHYIQTEKGDEKNDIVFCEESHLPDGQPYGRKTCDITISVLTQNEAELMWSKAEIFGSIINDSHVPQLDETACCRTIERHVIDLWLVECARIANLIRYDEKKNGEPVATANNTSEQEVHSRGKDEIFRNAIAFVLHQFSTSDSKYKPKSVDTIIGLINNISVLEIGKNEYDKVKNVSPDMESQEIWDVAAYVLKRCFGKSGMKNEDIAMEATNISSYKGRENPTNASKRSKFIEKEFCDCIRPLPQSSSGTPNSKHKKSPPP